MVTATATTPDRLPLRLEDVPPAPPRRPRVLLVGTTLAAAASIALFGGLLAAYFAVRADFLASGQEQWLPDGATIPLAPGNMTMVTLLMSLVTVQWAVHAGKRSDRGHAYFAIALTVLLGVAHVVQIGYLWTQWGLPLNGEPTLQAVLLFTVLGLHIAMVAVALIFLTLMFLRSLGGQFTGRDVEGLSAAALYWYVTVAIFTVIWYGILIVK
ncbi:MAG: heme-copper oxidase subunit III [Acidimicrobiia bacterium]|jgi:heme/copper-type cytochrome/quinol oxidase subunit 3